MRGGSHRRPRRRGRAPALASAGDDETVPPLEAEGLERCRGGCPTGGDRVNDGAHALDGTVGRSLVDDLLVADHVVDHGTRLGQLECRSKVGGVAGLVGVDEDHVERSCLLLNEPLSGLGRRGALDHGDPVGDCGQREVGAGHLGILRPQIQGDDFPGRSNGPRKPDGGIAGQVPNSRILLAPASCATKPGKAPWLGDTSALGGRQGDVLTDQCFSEVAVDGLPCRRGRVVARRGRGGEGAGLAHAPSVVPRS